MNDILSGQLNVDMNEVDDNQDYYRQTTGGSSLHRQRIQQILYLILIEMKLWIML